MNITIKNLDNIKTEQTVRLLVKDPELHTIRSTFGCSLHWLFILKAWYSLHRVKDGLVFIELLLIVRIRIVI